MFEKSTYIIGDHRAKTWTSFINSHNSSQLTHASIDGLRGLIVFHETVYGFHEVFLNYGVHISMSEHQPMNPKIFGDGFDHVDVGGKNAIAESQKAKKGWSTVITATTETASIFCSVRPNG